MAKPVACLTSASDHNTFNEIKIVPKQFKYRGKKKPTLEAEEGKLTPFGMSVPLGNLVLLFTLVSDLPPIKKLY